MNTRKRCTTPRICQYCNFTFLANAYQVSIGKAKFCSIDCWYAVKDLPPEQRFWLYVQKTETCWLWTGGKDKDGYGKFSLNGKTVRAHVYSFTLHGGNLSTGYQVCHSCDNPPCIRPDHLWAGTGLENHQDKAIKGRACVRKSNSRFNDTQIQIIRSMCANGASHSALARHFNVSTSLIDMIHARKRYGLVPDWPSLSKIHLDLLAHQKLGLPKKKYL